MGFETGSNEASPNWSHLLSSDRSEKDVERARDGVKGPRSVRFKDRVVATQNRGKWLSVPRLQHSSITYINGS